ncbi:MAG: AAA family ATPase [Desulfobacteraceae bacterium]|nr:MAG: AAA family ATPase [Desulfobacteraceae bacterium]
MLTKIKIKNFKKLDEVEFELGKTVILIGPNNSGKTTALQALALWDIGHRLWNAKRSTSLAKQRTGVTINRRDLIAIPVPIANLLWRDLHTRSVERVNGKPVTQNIFIEIEIAGISGGKEWSCGLEFYYSNEESFYCRPLKKPGEDQSQLASIPEEASAVKVAFLPPMSGLSAEEPKLEVGRINVLIGEGQTAQVLRNLCYQIYERSPNQDWRALKDHIERLFGITLLSPEYIKERGEITMAYLEPNRNRTRLDLSSAGRGVQQTILLLSHLYANPGTVLLLDEPDAHLEVLRQRQTYQLLTDVAEKQNSQIIAASHSEIILKEAADRDMVVAFVGKPHRIDDRGSQVYKALKEIGFDQYYLAEETGWILYLEGSSDLSILLAFARKLNHAASALLERPFVRYVGTNIPQNAREHFYGLREAKKDLVGIAIFDRIDKELQQNTPLTEIMWKKREIENYLCFEEVLMKYAAYDLAEDNLFVRAEINRREQAMKESIDEISKALETLKKPSPWSSDIKITDDFLDALFDRYFEKIHLPNLLRKTDYYVLANLVPTEKIDQEVLEKLNAIEAVANRAKPREN